MKNNKYRLLCSIFLLFTFFCSPKHLQSQTVSGYFTADDDGDGVPNTRDKCPDTDKNLEGKTAVVEFNGKKYPVKMVNFKNKIQERRRRILIGISKIDKEKVALIKSVGGKIEKLDEKDQLRIKVIDSLEKIQKFEMSEVVYESTIQIDGKPQVLEVRLGVDNFGCLPDRDRDGVPDLTDLCPDNPGTIALQGCSDRDGDGVYDHEDDCPDEPGLKRLKGCPDKGLGDRDGDGVIDKDDLCPDVKGSKENKGCPDIVTKEQKEIIAKATKVLFEVAKADLRPQSFPILNQLVEVIKDLNKKFGKVNIRLEGHTDSDGTNQDNLILSRNRARSVKEYLVSKGIDGNTISTAGFGEEKPITTNSNPQGKQQNRRVEIAITNASLDK